MEIHQQIFPNTDILCASNFPQYNAFLYVPFTTLCIIMELPSGCLFVHTVWLEDFIATSVCTLVQLSSWTKNKVVCHLNTSKFLFHLLELRFLNTRTKLCVRNIMLKTGVYLLVSASGVVELWSNKVSPFFSNCFRADKGGNFVSFRKYFPFSRHILRMISVKCSQCYVMILHRRWL